MQSVFHKNRPFKAYLHSFFSICQPQFFSVFVFCFKSHLLCAAQSVGPLLSCYPAIIINGCCIAAGPGGLCCWCSFAILGLTIESVIAFCVIRHQNYKEGDSVHCCLNTNTQFTAKFLFYLQRSSAPMTEHTAGLQSTASQVRFYEG